jgi:hypothetical protein
MKFPNFINKFTLRQSGFYALALVLILTGSFIAQTNGKSSDNDLKEAAERQNISKNPGITTASPIFTEVVENANLDCKQIIPRPNSTVIDPNDLFLLFGGVYDDTFQFTSYVSAEGAINLSGTFPSVPPGGIHVRTAGNNQVASFLSEKPITAVIVNVMTNSAAYIFYYNPAVLNGGPLGPPSTDNRQTASMHFCFEPNLSPTAAPATIAGRVVSADGMGLRGVSVRLMNASTGEMRSALTNGFGYYIFEDMPTEDFYIVSVSSKRYTFPVSVRTFTLQDSLTELDFIAGQ